MQCSAGRRAAGAAGAVTVESAIYLAASSARIICPPTPNQKAFTEQLGGLSFLQTANRAHYQSLLSGLICYHLVGKQSAWRRLLVKRAVSRGLGVMLGTATSLLSAERRVYSLPFSATSASAVRVQLRLAAVTVSPKAGLLFLNLTVTTLTSNCCVVIG